ncbi:hypothetical protein D9M71_466490 [compost metagenome]
MVGGQHAGGLEKGHAVGDPVPDEEVGQGRNREVGENLRQGVDLVLLAHGADLEEGETGMHGQHHYGAHQDEQGVGTVDQGLHGAIEVFHWRRELRQRGKSTKAVQGGPGAHHPDAMPHRKGPTQDPALVRTDRRKDLPLLHLSLVFIGLSAHFAFGRPLPGAPIESTAPQPRTSPMQALYQRPHTKFRVNLGRRRGLLGMESYKENRHAP